MSQVKFTVYGPAQPQGSMRAFVVKGHAILTSTSKGLKPWRQEVARTAAEEARKQVGLNLLDGPWIKRPKSVALYVHFYFSRPKSLKKSRTQKTTKPDIDKLVRGLADAMKGIMYEDDSQIVAIEAGKYFGTTERTEVTVDMWGE